MGVQSIVMTWTRFNVTEGAICNLVYCVFEGINCYSQVNPHRPSEREYHGKYIRGSTELPKRSEYS